MTNASSSLDMYEHYISAQIKNMLLGYEIARKLVKSLKVLQWLKPKQIQFVDVGTYATCAILDNKLCNCSIADSLAEKEKHWAGKPSYVDVSVKLPVSSFIDLWYNKGGLYQWQWTLRVMTEKSFLLELQKRPELVLDIFTYPVNSDYLTPATTKAALYRWLKLYCPRLDYNLELVSRDASTLLVELKGDKR